MDPEVLVGVTRTVAQAAGAAGMVGGQVADIEAEGQDVNAEGLAYIHTHKTAALIRASVVSGAMLGGGSPVDVGAMVHFGSSVGLAFQIVDDILDVIGDAETLGKAVGGDVAHAKATYPAIHGLEASRAEAERLVKKACGALEPFGGRGESLRALALFVVERQW
jgi:geranylgeranyl diphosphate synthase type II